MKTVLFSLGGVTFLLFRQIHVRTDFFSRRKFNYPCYYLMNKNLHGQF